MSVEQILLYFNFRFGLFYFIIEIRHRVQNGQRTTEALRRQESTTCKQVVFIVYLAPNTLPV